MIERMNGESETDKQTNRQTNRQADTGRMIQTHRQTDRE